MFPQNNLSAKMLIGGIFLLLNTRYSEIVRVNTIFNCEFILTGFSL